MSNIQQVKREDWDDDADPVYLAVLPFRTDELVSELNLEFFEYEDDGLGLAQSCIIQIENIKYWLCAHPQGPEISQHINVHVRSYEPNTDTARLKLLNELNIEKKSLMHCQDQLGAASWILYRIDDNGNKFEMNRFHQKNSANWFCDKYEAKGHKQKYFVSKAT